MDFFLSSDEDNERIVLEGAVRTKEYFEVFDSTVPTDFLKAEHRCVAAALKEIEKAASPGLVLAFCKKTDFVVPELEYIKKLYLPPLSPIEEYKKHVEILKADSRRRVIEDELLPQLIEHLAKKSEPIGNISDIASSIKDIADSGAAKIYLQSTKELLDSYRVVEEARRNKSSFYSCGFRQIDQELTRGLFPSGVTIVAGRPGMGKSSFVISSATSLSFQKVPVLLFTLEMSSISTTDRIISREAHISLSQLVKHFHDLPPSQLQQIEDVKKRLLENEWLYICDKPGVSLRFIREQIKRFQNVHGVKYVVVYIDLFGKIKDLNEANMAQSYEKNLNVVQSMARELGVHFVLAAQISRASERGKSIWSYRPKLHDIKNSGAWEEVADLILFLFRGKYYDDSLKEDVLEIKIAKQRDGVMNTTKYFQFVGEYALILNADVFPADRRSSGDRQSNSAVYESSPETVSKIRSARRGEMAD